MKIKTVTPPPGNGFGMYGTLFCFFLLTQKFSHVGLLKNFPEQHRLYRGNVALLLTVHFFNSKRWHYLVNGFLFPRLDLLNSIVIFLVSPSKYLVTIDQLKWRDLLWCCRTFSGVLECSRMFSNVYSTDFVFPIDWSFNFTVFHESSFAVGFKVPTGCLLFWINLLPGRNWKEK